MNQNLLEYYKIEINDLIKKKLIRPSKLSWRCATFYIQKNKKIKKEIPRLVINYKSLNKAFRWIRYTLPNKKDILNRTIEAKIFSKFDLKS